MERSNNDHTTIDSDDFCQEQAAMSQSTLSAPQLSGPAQQLDDYLQRQMRKASAQVRLVDLFTSIMTLLVVFLGTLFLVALIDAWIFELRPWMRLAVLGAIVVSALAYIFVVIVPLSIRRINPVYAARVVESARPDIKNGLINYLLLRSFGREEKAVSQRVIELVGSRAANDISGLEVSETVDKSNTIRIAMLLVVIVTLLGLYKVFSPKDPFQTFARVIAPFADVARPARVRISDITPGNTTVYFGQPMPVSARISGQFDNDSVNLVYSTTDGQEMDKRVPMRPSESGDGTWVVLLKTDDRGIGHSLDYHIEAGDGESIEYTMLLKSTPMLTIDSITYQPPAYTKLPEQTVTGTSDISALEGTLVTLRAVANTGLQSAAVELLMQRSDSQFDVVNTVSMEIVESKRAECKFRLQLDNKRQAQRYSHYRLNLVTVEGKPGEPAAPCPVRVIPDLPPEILVLDPTDTELSVPVNSRIRFVIRAQDPDFELTKISVAGDSSVYRVFEQDIPFPRDADLGGQINTRFDLWPKKLKMREGDTILLAFAAFDNRRIASNDAHDPNRTLTANYIVNVTGAIENPPIEKSEDDVEQEDTENNDSADDAQQAENQQDNPEEGTDNDQKNFENENIDSPSENESDPDDSESSPESDVNDGSKGEKDEKSGNEGEGKSNKGENENKQSPDSSNSGDAAEDSKSGSGTPNESDSEKTSDGNANSGNGKKSSTGDNNESESGESESKPANSAEGGNDPGSDSSTDSSTGGNESPAGEADPDRTEQPGQSGSNGQTGEPLDDDAHPGDIIEKINQIREQKEKSGNKSAQPNDSANKDEGSGKDSNSGNSSQDEPSGDSSNPKNSSDSSDGSKKSEPESADGASKEGDKSNSGSNKEQTKQNAGQDNQPSNEGSPSTSKDAGKKGSNNESNSSGGSGDDKQDDKNGSSDGGSDSGEKPNEQQPKPQEKSGGGGGEDKKQQSSGDSGSKDESGNPKQSDPTQPSGTSEGKDGESGTGEPGDSGSQESGSSAQGGTKPGEDGSASNGSNESGTASSDQQGNQDGNSQGSSGDQPGSEGSGKESQQPGNSGTSPGDNPGDNPSSQPGKGDSSGESTSGQDFSDQGSIQPGGSNNGGQPGGGNTNGQSSDGNNQAPSSTNIPDSADAANLEYTKRATDLALDYLTEQQVNPDPELLEQLNWTEEELRDFVKRWNELKKRSESGDARQKQEYEQVLRSLGLAPNNADVQQTQVERDQKKGYQEEGRVPNAPAGFRAFEKRRNRVDEKQPPG